MGRRPGHWPWIAIRRWIALDSFGYPTWVLPQVLLDGPWGCLPGCFPTQKLSYMNFIQKEHVKIDETCLDTQGRFKGTLRTSCVLGCLTSKLHENLH